MFEVGTRSVVFPVRKESLAQELGAGKLMFGREIQLVAAVGLCGRGRSRG